MTSVLSTGKYRSRKDWSTSSIPTLVSLEEETTPATAVITVKNGHQTANKPPRRSSLAIGLLGRGNSDKLNRRRSSLADAFLGRRDSSHKNKDQKQILEIPVISSKKFDQQEILSKTTPESDGENGPPFEKRASILSAADDDETGDHLNSIETNGSGDKELNKRRRRSSWQAKMERRRRKGFPPVPVEDANGDDEETGSSQGHGPNGPSIGSHHYSRQKRHSWWNIFVPDNLKQRSRRASQDVGTLSQNTENFIPFRSKSRSVDHGLAPFDLDSLKSKVEGRIDSVERLRDAKRAQPIPTITYSVGDRDTLTSVAARFDTTPSELSTLNRLVSSFIYPGQQLLVPDKSAIKSETGESSSNSGRSSPDSSRRKSNDDLQEEKELLDGLRPGSPKPGHIERISSPNTQNTDDDPVITQRFLKINVRHITDGQGVVGGVLLVTPNAVMFDPNVSDPLVIEHGPESYGVIAPMELVVNAAIFHDIAHMRVGNETSNEKPEVYYPKPQPNRYENTHSPGKDSLLVKDETFPELGLGSVEGCDDQESICSSNEREGDAFPKAFDRDLVTPTNLQQASQGESTDSAGASAAAAAATAAGGLEKTLSTDSTTQSAAADDNATKDTKSQAISSSKKTEDGSKKEDDKKSDQESTDDTFNADLQEIRSLEERRKSLLDHHWAIPRKDSQRSLEDEEMEESNESITTIVPITGINHHATAAVASLLAEDDTNQLVKLSCHDSGIDIRDPNSLPLPNVQPIVTKKVYSDADIVLSSDWVPPIPLPPTHFTNSPPKPSSMGSAALSAQASAQAQNLEHGGRKKTSSVSFSVEDNEQPISDKQTGDKKNKMLKRLSYPLAWVEGLTGETNKSESTESAPNTGDSNQSVFSKVFSSSPITLVSEFGGNLFLSKTPSEDSGGSPVPPLTPHSEGHGTPGRSSIGTFIRPSSSDGSSQPSQKSVKPPPPKLDYRSMVSIDDMPELFVSFDKLIPRPARACPDPPLYLRLRMGRPLGKAPPLPTSVMSYGKNKLRPEYWFSIPKNRVDELFRFLNSWVPHLYGELDEEKVTARGYELVQHDTEWAQGGISKEGRINIDGEDIAELTRESWELLKAPYVKIFNIIKSQTGSNDLEGSEVLSMSADDYRKTALFPPGSFDLDFPIPDLIGQTEILTEEHREKLCGHLPARAEGYSWSLIFSTSQHGFSLNSLYRKMHRLESPILIVIQDTENNVFGALTSCSLHVSDHFYGTGESLLYKFNPSFKVFHWTGENLYFIKGNPESLSIGAGDGKFGLWLDGDLNQGRSQHCSTYANEPLAPQEDFVIKTMECWAFV